MLNIRDVLKKKGPLVSSELIDLILKNNPSMKRLTIRKRISRAHKEGKILVNKNLPLIHGQYVYYLPEHSELLETLKFDFLQKFGGAAKNRLLRALEFPYYRGVLDIRTGQKIVGLPLSHIKSIKKSSFNRIIKHLVRSNFIKILNINGIDFIVDHLLLKENQETMEKINRKAQFIINSLKAETEIRRGVLSWSEQNNLIAWRKAKDSPSINKLTLFNDLPWDAVGPSYVEPVRNSRGVPRPILFETVTNRELREFDVEGFINRINILRFRIFRTDYRPMGIIICYNFTKEAQSLAKKHGLLIITLENFLGKAYKKFFDDIKKFKLMEGEDKEEEYSHIRNATYNYLATQQNLDQALYFSILGNMRGILLEVLIGYIFRINHYQTFLRLAHIDGFDIIAEKKYEREKWIIECKAYAEKSENNLYKSARGFLEKIRTYLNNTNIEEIRKNFAKINACFISIHNPSIVKEFIEKGKLPDIDEDKALIRVKKVKYLAWGSQNIIDFTPEIERPKIREILKLLKQCEILT